MIETSEKSNDLERRLQILYDEITLTMYVNVSRGLFERHKIVYSFMLNMAILLNKGVVSYSEWNFLLRGAGPIEIVIMNRHTINLIKINKIISV